MAKEFIGGIRLSALKFLRRSVCEQHRSLRTWRKLVIAFRSAAHVNDEDRVLAYTIENPTSECEPCIERRVLTNLISLR